ncbi:MAG: hypothetical protein ACTSQP_16840 [Promethearchaeota archaeon]
MIRELSDIEDKIIIYCENCGWQIPIELIEKLLNDNIIYCEACGSPWKKSDFDINLLNRAQKIIISPETSIIIPSLRDLSSKVFKKIRSKIKDITQKRGKNKY